MKRMMLVPCLAATMPVTALAQDAAAGEKVYAVCRPRSAMLKTQVG